MSRRRTTIEVVLVVVAPMAAFFAYRVRPMMPGGMIDPSFYSAYATHPRDLMARYGPVAYFWTRVGFVLPAAASARLFGALGGFYAWRYALALVALGPAALLLRRTCGRLGSTVAVLSVLSSPVLWFAWGTDYPDSAAVSYLVAAVCAVAMPSEHRLRWVAFAGVCAALTLQCQLVALPLVAGLALALVSSGTGRRPRRGPTTAGPRVASSVEWVEPAIFAVAIAVATMVLMGASWAVLGEWDTLTPNVRQARQVQRMYRFFHTADPGWILHVGYLLVPPLILVVWLLTRTGGGARPSRAERTVAVATAWQVLFFTIEQFALRQPTLQYHYYSSMLWPAPIVLFCFTVTGLLRRVSRHRSRWVLLAVATAVPALLAGVVPRIAPLGWFGVGGALVVGAVGSAVVHRREAGARSAMAAVAGIPLVVMALGTARVPPSHQLPTAQYDTVFATSGTAQLREYRLAARLPELVGTQPGGGTLLMWWPSGTTDFDALAGQYLWHKNALSRGLPVLTGADLELLHRRRPKQFLLMAPSRSLLAAAEHTLGRNGYRAASGPTIRYLGKGERGADIWVEIFDVSGR